MTQAWNQALNEAKAPIHCIIQMKNQFKPIPQVKIVVYLMTTICQNIPLL